MFARLTLALATVLAAPSAMAAADLATTMTVDTSPALTYSTARYTVAVRNIGNKNASNCSVQIALPATHTSPQVYVLGILGAKSAACTQSGTTLNCTLGTINRNTTKTVFFDIALPVSTDPYEFTATASTTSAQNSTANDSATRTASETYYATTIDAQPGVPAAMEHSHCTGTGLTAWYECTLFPSSISAFAADYHDDGTITIPGEPDFTGTWTVTTTASGNALSVTFSDPYGVVAEFEGWGADASCFEGMTTFPGGGPYVAPYEICPL